MKKRTTLALALICIALFLLQSRFAPVSTLLAGVLGEGDTWFYLPLAQNQGGVSLPTPTPTGTPTPVATATATPTSTPTSGPAVLAGAGDIATCDGVDDEATAALLDGIPGTVFTTGDNAYTDGTLEEFQSCYEPSWGRHKARTRPAAGNHDYHTPGAAGYFAYFGPAAGTAGKGYYSYNLGAWHIIVLNSNCAEIASGDLGGCEAGSPQEQWLRQELVANPRLCTLAYFHHPLFSSGRHGGSNRTEDLWQVLYDHGVDVVLNGHDHHYERFAPQDPAGNADPHGIRQFVVGTGGRSLYDVGDPVANSEARSWEAYGVLKLTLHPVSYDWQFVAVPGATFSDAGSHACH